MINIGFMQSHMSFWKSLVFQDCILYSKRKLNEKFLLKLTKLLESPTLHNKI